jgi:PadR family transcriptional regulator PadR
MLEQRLYAGLIRLHILHHAAEQDFFGQWMIDELSRHGYRLSPGTLYPILHTMERQGYLRSRLARAGGRRRRLYRATPAGRKALAGGRRRVQELFGEMFRTDRRRGSR